MSTRELTPAQRRVLARVLRDPQGYIIANGGPDGWALARQILARHAKAAGKVFVRAIATRGPLSLFSRTFWQVVNRTAKQHGFVIGIGRSKDRYTLERLRADASPKADVLRALEAEGISTKGWIS